MVACGRAGDDGEGDGAVAGFDVGEDGGDRAHVGDALQVELLFAVSGGDRVEAVAEPFVQHFDGARQGDTTPAIEEVLWKVATLLAHGLLPADEVQGHGVSDGAIKIEEIGLEDAWRQGQGCGQRLG